MIRIYLSNVNNLRFTYFYKLVPKNLLGHVEMFHALLCEVKIILLQLRERNDDNEKAPSKSAPVTSWMLGKSAGALHSCRDRPVAAVVTPETLGSCP